MLAFVGAGGLRAATIPPAQPKLPTRAEIDGILGRLSQITGMPVRRELKFQSITRAGVSDYLDDRAGKKGPDKQDERQQAALEFLGLIPRGFDWHKTTLALMAEQAAAFYDFHKKALFLTDWTPASMRDTAVVHELAHALADQNYNLGRYSRKVENDDEKSAAREAVMEGQASYLMFSYDALEAGGNPLNIHPNAEAFDDTVKPSGDYPVFDRAPLYLRMSLVFPYTWGMEFQAALIDRLGREGFEAPFRKPPVSTRQILHPELYLAGETERPLALPKAPHGFKAIFEGELGELDHLILIEQYGSASQAQKLSPGWRGGGFLIVERKRDHRRMLLYCSRWADDKSGRAFLAFTRQWLRGKSKKFVVLEQGPGWMTGQTDRGYFRAGLQDGLVTLTEGSDEPL